MESSAQILDSQGHTRPKITFLSFQIEFFWKLLYFAFKFPKVQKVKYLPHL